MIGCNKAQVILAIVVLILALWPNLIGAVASKWVIVVAAILIVVSACKTPCVEMPAAPVRKARRKKRR